jgi:serine/threonine protein kinase
MQVFLTPTHLAIAMEYAQGGDLFNYTLGHRPHGRLAEQQARWIFQQLIIGLDYCHRRVSQRHCKERYLENTFKRSAIGNGSAMCLWNRAQLCWQVMNS